jgi:hypothetical protein
MNVTRIKFRLTPSAIIDDHRKELKSEAWSGNIYWMLYTLENVYGIKLTQARARKLAKEKAIMAVNFSESKHLTLNWHSVNKHNLPSTLTQQEEVCVKIEQI